MKALSIRLHLEWYRKFMRVTIHVSVSQTKMDTLDFIENQNETIALLIVGQISEASYNICWKLLSVCWYEACLLFPAITQRSPDQFKNQCSQMHINHQRLVLYFQKADFFSCASESLANYLIFIFRFRSWLNYSEDLKIINQNLSPNLICKDNSDIYIFLAINSFLDSSLYTVKLKHYWNIRRKEWDAGHHLDWRFPCGWLWQEG